MCIAESDALKGFDLLQQKGTVSLRLILAKTSGVAYELQLPPYKMSSGSLHNEPHLGLPN